MGYSGIVSDKSAIQFKMLNKSRGQPCGLGFKVIVCALKETWRLLSGTNAQS